MFLCKRSFLCKTFSVMFHYKYSTWEYFIVYSLKTEECITKRAFVWRPQGERRESKTKSYKAGKPSGDQWCKPIKKINSRMHLICDAHDSSCLYLVPRYPIYITKWYTPLRNERKDLLEYLIHLKLSNSIPWIPRNNEVYVTDYIYFFYLFDTEFVVLVSR